MRLQGAVLNHQGALLNHQGAVLNHIADEIQWLRAQVGHNNTNLSEMLRVEAIHHHHIAEEIKPIAEEIKFLMQRSAEQTGGILRLADELRDLGSVPPGRPSDVILNETDNYENLDQNWLSINCTSGRQETSTAIDGDRKRTAVVIVLGQSNAANHGAGKYVAKHWVDNFNIYDGKCYHAEDPLLGASGDGGNFATRLGDKLIQDGLFDRVILAPIAMGGTTVEQWADQGMFNRRIPVLIRRLHDAGLSADYILWHQGEGNPGMGDRGGRQYRKNLLEVVQTFRRYGLQVPFFVALATLCGGPHANAENIRSGQKSVVDPSAGIYQGPDTDVIGVEHRWDKCHFDELGLSLAAALWLEVLADYETGQRRSRSAAA